LERPKASGQKPPAGDSAGSGGTPLSPLPAAVEALERRMIENALHETAGNKQKAAQVLGLSRQGLIKKLKRLGM